MQTRLEVKRKRDLYVKKGCLFLSCLFCGIEISPKHSTSSSCHTTLLVPSESPCWVRVHQVGFIMVCVCVCVCVHHQKMVLERKLNWVKPVWHTWVHEWAVGNTCWVLFMINWVIWANRLPISSFLTLLTSFPFLSSCTGSVWVERNFVCMHRKQQKNTTTKRQKIISSMEFGTMCLAQGEVIWSLGDDDPFFMYYREGTTPLGHIHSLTSMQYGKRFWTSFSRHQFTTLKSVCVFVCVFTTIIFIHVSSETDCIYHHKSKNGTTRWLPE
jgi:hypothetical protein